MSGLISMQLPMAMRQLHPGRHGQHFAAGRRCPVGSYAYMLYVYMLHWNAQCADVSGVSFMIRERERERRLCSSLDAQAVREVKR